MDLRHRLQALVEPRLGETHVELVDVQIGVDARHRILRFLVDRPGGVTLDDCAAISRRIEDWLDTEDLVPFRYVLEVSSPGLDRPLTKPNHFERFAGERVVIRMTPAFGPRRRFTGTLEGLRGGDVCVRGENGEESRLPLDQVESAQVSIDPWKGRGRAS